MDGKIIGILLFTAFALFVAPQIALMGFLSPVTIAGLLLFWLFLALCLITPCLIVKKNDCISETEESD